MKRIVLARPGVSAPIPVVVGFLLAGVGAVATIVLYLLGFATTCSILPVVAASGAFSAALFWTLGGVPPASTRRLRRGAIAIIVCTLWLAVTAIRCRLA